MGSLELLLVAYLTLGRASMLTFDPTVNIGTLVAIISISITGLVAFIRQESALNNLAKTYADKHMETDRKLTDLSSQIIAQNAGIVEMAKDLIRMTERVNERMGVAERATEYNIVWRHDVANEFMKDCAVKIGGFDKDLAAQKEYTLSLRRDLDNLRLSLRTGV